MIRMNRGESETKPDNPFLELCTEHHHPIMADCVEYVRGNSLAG